MAAMGAEMRAGVDYKTAIYGENTPKFLLGTAVNCSTKIWAKQQLTPTTFRYLEKSRNPLNQQL